MVRKIQQFVNPDCLGQMPKRYCRYCSEICPISALCVLMVMGEYLRHDHEAPPPKESSQTRESLPTSPEET